MAVRVAINGFGRIGRNVARAIIRDHAQSIELIAINDSAPIETNMHLLKYDSVHGILNDEIKKIDSDCFEINKKQIKKISSKIPENIPWGDLNIDLVLECTGKFNDRKLSVKHVDAGAKKVLISAPAKAVDKTAVFGVNHMEIAPEHIVISNASCTTNALAPMMKVLNDTVGIDSAFMTTIHSYTGDQPTLDRNHKDLYRSRSAAQSIIPTTTGAAISVGEVIPQLKGRIDGMAMRVPTPNVSVIDLKFIANQATSFDEINEILVQASNNQFLNILKTTNEKLVSIDVNHDSHSAVIALDQTRVTNKTLVRVMAWYDNEWGFSQRMCDMAKYIGKLS
ncbi:type I glyceraldehyde-3-phosphate dehydrogenase [Gammaproteobacteria bacterium]|nr:type I glyceraldehyde-3-phosphate dehydrogenase [Gammaproteobacteria bacterium]